MGEVDVEPRKGAVPAVGRGRRVVRGTRVAVEAMFRVGVTHHFGVDGLIDRDANSARDEPRAVPPKLFGG